ncbi:hypothetical protein BDP27DRAFT_1324334 [Rhodocollybia butyracea]|uniref:DUF6534 domain-containing protein n=1 Tax=Rhodocollybia butyracea TaxID=206335 RepID=A0A9P5PQ63_9AGAR|nr:hypothetical protein BDP27DRAFT_1324334 [Rhodocollybia butyracea]
MQKVHVHSGRSDVLLLGNISLFWFVFHLRYYFQDFALSFFHKFFPECQIQPQILRRPFFRWVSIFLHLSTLSFTVSSSLPDCLAIVQLWTYINMSRDRWLFRVLVISLFLLDLAATYFDVGLLHFYLVSHFGDVFIFTTPETFLIIEILLTAVIVFVVDLYFASRVAILKQVHWSVLVVIVTTDVLALFISILSVIISFNSVFFANHGFTPEHNEIVIGIENGISTVCEMLATAALAWSLRSSRTGASRTDSVLLKLYSYTITRGILLTVIQVLALVVYLAQPSKLTWLAFHMCLSKLYFITMSEMLNTRPYLRRSLDRTITDSEVGEVIRRCGPSIVRGTSFVLESNADSHQSESDYRLTQLSTSVVSEDPEDHEESMISVKGQENFLAESLFDETGTY